MDAQRNEDLTESFLDASRPLHTDHLAQRKWLRRNGEHESGLQIVGMHLREVVIESQGDQFQKETVEEQEGVLVARCDVKDHIAPLGTRILTVEEIR